MKGFWRSLYGRISLLYLVLSLVLALVCAGITVRYFDLFMDAVDQKLNRQLAAKLVPQVQKARADTTYDGALAEVGNRITMFHPALEMYVLDERGRVRAASIEPSPEAGPLARDAVDLGPIEAYLDGAAVPVWGDDPTSTQGTRVFSAAEMKLAGGGSGYLYVILSGRAARAAEGMLQNTYIRRTLLLSLLLAMGVTVVVGLFLFRLLTRRFDRLSATVQRFKNGHLEERVEVDKDDEIGQLARAFNEMADTISAQMTALRRTDEERRRLVAEVSHDFRTPLTSIRGHAERMLDNLGPELSEDHRRRLRVIVQNADRLDRLADQLHELSRLDARQADPDVESFSLAELVQDLVVKFQPKAEEEDVELEADTSLDLPAVRGDIGLIERLLSNLVDNALENTPSGGRVTIRIEEENGAVTVRVLDTGIGIPEEDLPLVTQRFYRIDRDGTSPIDGEDAEKRSGLGLAISEEIAHLHETELSIESREGEGTAVSFELPKAQKQTAS